MRIAAAVLSLTIGSLGGVAMANDPEMPSRLEKADIIAGMRPVSAPVAKCGEASATKLSFKVKVVVSPKGKVSSADVQTDALDDATKQCVVAAVKTAQFKQTQAGLTFSWPFNFR